MRMPETPQMDITLVKSTESPGGIGEPGAAIVVASTANAVSKALNKRIRMMPMTAENLARA
jgi:isoquinoline 1-oxidoreductase beta subunit